MNAFTIRLKRLHGKRCFLLRRNRDCRQARVSSSRATQPPQVSWHCVVIEVSLHHPLQPGQSTTGSCRRRLRVARIAARLTRILFLIVRRRTVNHTARVLLQQTQSDHCIDSNGQLLSDNGLSPATVFGPECVKTLSYLACFSPLLLDVAISRFFTTISVGNASARV